MSTLTEPTEAMVEIVARGEYLRIKSGLEGEHPIPGCSLDYPDWEALTPARRAAYMDRARFWLRIALPLVTEAMVIERMREIEKESK